MKKENNLSSLAFDSLIVAVVTCLVNLGVFVTYKDMYAYAAPNKTVTQMSEQIHRIELKVNELCVKQNINYEEIGK